MKAPSNRPLSAISAWNILAQSVVFIRSCVTLEGSHSTVVPEVSTGSKVPVANAGSAPTPSSAANPQIPTAPTAGNPVGPLGPVGPVQHGPVGPIGAISAPIIILWNFNSPKLPAEDIYATSIYALGGVGGAVKTTWSVMRYSACTFSTIVPEQSSLYPRITNFCPVK